MKDFTVANFLRLRELFKNKDWLHNDNESEIFKRFSHLIFNLNKDEQDLILDLSEQYLWITYSKYIPLLTELFASFNDENLKDVTHLYFFPIIKPKDEDDTKSGNILLYLFKAITPTLPEPLKSINFTIIEQFDKILPENFEMKPNELFILLDDFIGSGTTMSATFTEIGKNPSIANNNIRVVSIAIMRESTVFLNERHVPFYSKHIISKGITDHYGDLATEKLEVMRKIEKMTTAGKNFKMGYKKSEALITMARTPNNTFSIFWASHIKEDIEYPAPFSRI